MAKIFKLILITVITIFGIGFLLIPSTWAQTQNLVVEFENTPLFEEVNFLPGQTISRWVKLVNNTDQSQRIAIEGINISDPDNLGLVLNLEIKEGTTVLYNSPLSTFFDTGEVFLSELAGNGSQKQYDFAVSFYPGAHDNFQGKNLNFDILVGFQGTGGGILPGAGGGGGGTVLPSGLTILEESVISTAITETSVTITWSTSYFSTSQVIYAIGGESYTFDLTQPNYGYPHAAPSPEDSTKVSFHSVTISGLSPDTTYYFRCVSHASPPSISREYSFTTLKPGEISTKIEKIVMGESTTTKEESAVKEKLESEGGISEEGEITDEEEEKYFEESEPFKERSGINNFLATVGHFFSNLTFRDLVLIVLIIIILFLILLFIFKKKTQKNI